MKKLLGYLLSFLIGATLFFSLPVFADTIGTLNPFKIIGTFIVPRNASNTIGTSTANIFAGSATTTNLAITGITSLCLETDGSGNVIGVACSGVGTNDVGASTQNYFTYYNSANTVTGTPVLVLDPTNGRVGLNTSVPSATLHVVSTEGATVQSAIFDKYGANAFFTGRRANGTPAAPTAVLNNQILFTISSRGFDGTAFSGSQALMRSITQENWTTSSHGTAWDFLVTPNSSTVAQQALKLDQNGFVGINTTTPSDYLSVSGNETLTGDIYPINTNQSLGRSTTTWNSLYVTTSTLTYLNSTNVTSTGFTLTGTLNCNTASQALQTGSGGTISCGTLSFPPPPGIVGTSTANYFAFYNNATTVTGTPLLQFSNGAMTVTTNTALATTTITTTTITQGNITTLVVGSCTGCFTLPLNATFTSVTTTNLFATTSLFISATTTNLNVSGITNLGATTITNATSTNLNVSGVTNLANTTITNATTTNLNVSGATSVGTLTFTNATGTNFNLSGLFNLSGSQSGLLIFGSSTVAETAFLGNGISSTVNIANGVGTSTINIGTNGATGLITLGNGSVPVSITTSTISYLNSTNVTTTGLNFTNEKGTSSTITYLNATTVTSTNYILAGTTSQCLQTDSNGKITGTGSACSGGSNPPPGVVATSTANYFTYYTSATTVTGTSFVQNSGNVIAFTTGTTFTTSTITYINSTNVTTTGLTFTNLNGTNATSTNLNVGTNLTFTSATGTNLRLTGALSVAGTSTFASGTFSGWVGVGTTTPQQKLHVVDGTLLVDNPVNPVLLGSSSTVNATAVYVAGKYAYLADGTGGFKVFDITDPSNPTSTATLTNPNLSQGVQVVGKYAYVADNTNGIKMIDISNPVSPTVYRTLTAGNVPVTQALGLYVSGEYVFEGEGSSAGGGTLMNIIDLSNNQDTAIGAVGLTSNNPTGVYVNGKYAYIVGDGGLDIVNIANPAAPLTKTNLFFGGATKVYVSGRFAYVADGTNGLKIIDISNPTSPTTTATLAAASSSQDVYVSGKYAYVAAGANGLKIVDISSSTAPRVISTFASTNAQGVYVAGKYVYLADGTGGLKIIDIKGADISTANIGNLATNDLTVWENANVGNDLSVGNSITAGAGGLFDNGILAVSGTAAFMGNGTFGGTLGITGLSSLTTMTFTSATGTNLNLSGLLSPTKINFTSATGTNLNITGSSNLSNVTTTNLSTGQLTTGLVRPSANNTSDLGVLGTAAYRNIFASGTSFVFNALPSNAATDNLVCWSTTNGQLNQEATSCTISTLRVKDNITPFSDGLKLISGLDIINYDEVHDGKVTNKDQVGFAAENIDLLDSRFVVFEAVTDTSPSAAKIYAEGLAKKDPSDFPTYERALAYVQSKFASGQVPKTVNYEKMVVPLAKAIQEQQQEITELKALVAHQETLLEKIQKMLAYLIHLVK